MRSSLVLPLCLAAMALGLSLIQVPCACSGPPPTVTSVTPASGPPDGGTNVIIAGANFVEGMSLWVYFGGEPSRAFSFVDSSTIQAYTPPHADGAVDVTVSNPDQQSGTLANGFTYTDAGSLPYVSSVTPNYGPLAGGTQVALTGSSFSGATAVTFGGTAAASFAVASDGAIAAVSPPHAAGAVDVTVTTPAGTSAQTPTDQFTYTDNPPPAVISVSPSSGPAAGGTAVTISGANLTGATAVAFGDTAAASFSVLSSTTISAVAPAHFIGVVDVTVTTPDGTSARTASDQFTFTEGSCSLACSAAVPTTGTVNQAVSFQALATPSGCSGTPVFGWDFGDSQVSGEQNPSHTYTSLGTFAWTLTVYVQGATCQKSGTIAISGGGGCALGCSALVPDTAAPNVSVGFQATVSDAGCGGSPTFNWTFGDGQTSSEQNPSHAYASPGLYAWTLTVAEDGQFCQQYASVSVTAPPSISSVQELSSPFRLKVTGGNFHPDCAVKINGQTVPQTSFKSPNKVLAMKGPALKALCPKGQTVQITLTNNDDGGISAPFSFTP